MRMINTQGDVEAVGCVGSCVWGRVCVSAAAAVSVQRAVLQASAAVSVQLDVPLCAAACCLLVLGGAVMYLSCAESRCSLSAVVLRCAALQSAA
jgi:hypothetical protein